jgi:hypothetical protein
LSAAVSFKGKYCGFKGEVGATFNSGSTGSEFNEYAISYIEYKVTADMQLSRQQILLILKILFTLYRLD